jgi:hypothetical protein
LNSPIPELLQKEEQEQEQEQEQEEEQEQGVGGGIGSVCFIATTVIVNCNIVTCNCNM